MILYIVFIFVRKWFSLLSYIKYNRFSTINGEIVNNFQYWLTKQSNLIYTKYKHATECNYAIQAKDKCSIGYCTNRNTTTIKQDGSTNY